MDITNRLFVNFNEYFNRKIKLFFSYLIVIIFTKNDKFYEF